MNVICGVIHHGGRKGEPLACGLPSGHVGEHAWAGIPTFVDGVTATEKAADSLVRHILEFDTILSPEYVDALDAAIELDTHAVKARTDTWTVVAT